jgi:hypothetical protein
MRRGSGGDERLNEGRYVRSAGHDATRCCPYIVASEVAWPICRDRAPMTLHDFQLSASGKGIDAERERTFTGSRCDSMYSLGSR